MNNQYHIEGNFLVRNRGGLGDFQPIEIARYTREQRKMNQYIHHGSQNNKQLYRRIAKMFGVKVSTVRWCYTIAKSPVAGLSSKRTA